MSACSIRLFPDPVLRKACSKVEHFGQTLDKTVRLLIQTMKKQTHGIGIAAPQIGISQQIAIVDVSPRIPGAQMLVLVNPIIRELRVEKASREGCMSLPDYMGNIKRYDIIQVRWQNAAGTFIDREFSGIEAVCIQHEVDHLNGVLFMDRVASLKRDMIPRLRTAKSG